MTRGKIYGFEAEETGGEDLQHFVRRICPAEVHLLRSNCCVSMIRVSTLEACPMLRIGEYNSTCWSKASPPQR